MSNRDYRHGKPLPHCCESAPPLSKSIRHRTASLRLVQQVFSGNQAQLENITFSQGIRLKRKRFDRDPGRSVSLMCGAPPGALTPREYLCSDRSGPLSVRLTLCCVSFWVMGGFEHLFSSEISPDLEDKPMAKSVKESKQHRPHLLLFRIFKMTHESRRFIKNLTGMKTAVVHTIWWFRHS